VIDGLGKLIALGPKSEKPMGGGLQMRMEARSFWVHIRSAHVRLHGAATVSLRRQSLLRYVIAAMRRCLWAGMH